MILNDLMTEGGNNKGVSDLLTEHSHHQNIRVMYLCHVSNREICQEHFKECSLHHSLSKSARSAGHNGFTTSSLSFELARYHGLVP